MRTLTVDASVESADGTTIGYRARGAGPGVVLVHGAMQTAQNFSRLAEELSTTFSVYVPDRRGRGRSGAFGAEYGLAREAEDLDALLRKTDAHCVFGLSAGALIALYAARNIRGISKLAIYEPPLTFDDADPAAWVSRYRREVERGDLAAAMVTMLQGTGDVEPLTYLPRFVLAPLLRLALRDGAAKSAPDHVGLRHLIPTVRFDTMLQREAVELLPTLTEVSCDVLLMGGARSHRALRDSLDELARRMPRAERVRFDKIGHLAADDTGRPREVAQKLRAFFTA